MLTWTILLVIFRKGRVFSLSHCCPNVTMSHRCHAVVTPLWHCCHTVVTPLSHHCHTVVTPLSHRCHTVVTPLSHRCHTIVKLLSHRCHTVVTPLSHRCHKCYKSLGLYTLTTSRRPHCDWIETFYHWTESLSKVLLNNTKIVFTWNLNILLAFPNLALIIFKIPNSNVTLDYYLHLKWVIQPP